jgi:crotonobetainyl-CoA:carnitine CoA-transferase CaiB-like acyl-CoA transferase
METMMRTQPLEGIRVVELAIGTSVVGAGLAASLPGALLRDFGAEVTRITAGGHLTLDEGVEFTRVWDRGKEIIDVSDECDSRQLAQCAALAAAADVVFVAGREELVERRRLAYADLASANPGLIYVRIRPSVVATGVIADLELLLHARTGLLTQIRGHRPGPAFSGLAVGAAGAGLSAAIGALACLYERAVTGVGGWVETSMYDGMLAILPMIIGRVTFPSPSTASLWDGLGPSLALSFRCADGEYIQLWLGAKGAYDAFLAHMGDSPSEAGYAADGLSGAIGQRSERWAETFATQDRAWWLEHLAGHEFRCEPVLRPGDELGDPHLREIGLAVEHPDPERGTLTKLGPVCRVARVASPTSSGAEQRLAARTRLLSGVRVADLSAYLAGPVTPLILAELGADVVKVEPPTGDVHRVVEPMFAAGQRGKRSLAVDLKSPQAPEILRRLFSWSDVVHHNSRVGVAERLGYDEQTVRATRPDVVYCHASGFGPHGPRALLAANDHVMQALSGVEAAAGGEGQPPTFVPWGAIDVTGGWVAACGIVAGLYARRRTGAGQSVTSTLLGAGLTLTSGAFLAGGTRVEGPVVNHDQTGYGATYRIYRGRDDAHFALVVPDALTWDRLRTLVDEEALTSAPPALGTGPTARHVDDVLEKAFSSKSAHEWVTLLRAAAVPVELVVEEERAAFIARILDDPVNRQLGRVVSFDWGERGVLEQTALPLRFGPVPRPTAMRHIPRLGEHTDEILEAMGFDEHQRATMAASGAVRRAEPTQTCAVSRCRS